MIKINKSDYLPLFVIASIFLVMLLIGLIIPEDTVRAIMVKAGNWGIALLILFLWVTYVAAPLSATPFLFAGFYCYGQMSVVYAFVAAIIASVTNFWIARIWGRKAVVKLAGEKSLEKIDSLAKNYGLQTLFIFRLFLKEFHDVVSYAFGLTNLKFKMYFSVSTIGMIPATLLWYLISFKVKDPFTFIILNLLFAYISLALYVFWVKQRKANNRKRISGSPDALSSKKYHIL